MATEPRYHRVPETAPDAEPHALTTRPQPSDGADDTPDASASLARIERLLTDIHTELDALARDRAHERFSFAWLVGAILQMLVVALVVLAAIDLLFASDQRMMYVRLVFAMALQLIALTAFVVGGQERR